MTLSRAFSGMPGSSRPSAPTYHEPRLLPAAHAMDIALLPHLPMISSTLTPLLAPECLIIYPPPLGVRLEQKVPHPHRLSTLREVVSFYLTTCSHSACAIPRIFECSDIVNQIDRPD